MTRGLQCSPCHATCWTALGGMGRKRDTLQPHACVSPHLGEVARADWGEDRVVRGCLFGGEFSSILLERKQAPIHQRLNTRSRSVSPLHARGVMSNCAPGDGHSYVIAHTYR